MNLVESSTKNLSKIDITIPGDASGEYLLTEGTVFEKVNEWSPGVDGIGTEGNFGRLPIIKLNVE